MIKGVIRKLVHVLHVLLGIMVICASISVIQIVWMGVTQSQVIAYRLVQLGIMERHANPLVLVHVLVDVIDGMVHVLIVTNHIMEICANTHAPRHVLVDVIDGMAHVLFAMNHTMEAHVKTNAPLHVLVDVIDGMAHVQLATNQTMAHSVRAHATAGV